MGDIDCHDALTQAVQVEVDKLDANEASCSDHADYFLGRMPTPASSPLPPLPQSPPSSCDSMSSLRTRGPHKRASPGGGGGAGGCRKRLKLSGRGSASSDGRGDSTRPPPEPRAVLDEELVRTIRDSIVDGVQQAMRESVDSLTKAFMCIGSDMIQTIIAVHQRESQRQCTCQSSPSSGPPPVYRKNSLQ